MTFNVIRTLVWLDQGSKTVRSGFQPATFGFPDLPELEADALLIRPPWLVMPLHSGGWDIFSIIIGQECSLQMGEIGIMDVFLTLILDLGGQFSLCCPVLFRWYDERRKKKPTLPLVCLRRMSRVSAPHAGRSGSDSPISQNGRRML